MVNRAHRVDTGRMRVTVTGGAGYIGARATRELLSAGHEVTVLDSLLHGQEDVASALEATGVRVLRGDVRDPAARRDALDGAEAVVHLAAIVGDPACAKDPALSQTVNVDATRAVVADAERAGVERFVFASTCSNYGRMTDPLVAIDETAPLAPVSLYAEQKVAVETDLLARPGDSIPIVTCLRFATIYGVAERMRFDLTVNEFARDLWDARRLEVYGERFWRPYVHVADAARALATVLGAPSERVAGTVFNVGHSDENYRKVDLVELIRKRLPDADVHFVHRDEDPRDYRVSFARIGSELGFDPIMRVPDGVDEVLRGLDEGVFGDPFDRRFSNV
jgi:nucleoside-diphosphate-sugar epimerase